jgi:hypothetical protein
MLFNRTGDEEDEDDMEGDVDADDEFAFLSNYEKERKDMNDKIKQLESEVMDEDEGDDDGPMSKNIYTTRIQYINILFKLRNSVNLATRSAKRDSKKRSENSKKKISKAEDGNCAVKSKRTSDRLTVCWRNQSSSSTVQKLRR